MPFNSYLFSDNKREIRLQSCILQTAPGSLNPKCCTGMPILSFKFQCHGMHILSYLIPASHSSSSISLNLVIHLFCTTKDLLSGTLANLFCRQKKFRTLFSSHYKLKRLNLSLRSQHFYFFLWA